MKMTVKTVASQERAAQAELVKAREEKIKNGVVITRIREEPSLISSLWTLDAHKAQSVLRALLAAGFDSELMKLANDRRLSQECHGFLIGLLAGL